MPPTGPKAAGCGGKGGIAAEQGPMRTSVSLSRSRWLRKPMANPRASPGRAEVERDASSRVGSSRASRSVVSVCFCDVYHRNSRLRAARLGEATSSSSLAIPQGVSAAAARGGRGGHTAVARTGGSAPRETACPARSLGLGWRGRGRGRCQPCGSCKRPIPVRRGAAHRCAS